MRLPTHGLRRHPLYKTWISMKQRCFNKNSSIYSYYGGRGIGICKEWMTDFLCFYNWCIKNGWELGLELDRRDNENGYSPNNCRFVDRSTNCRNRRNNVYAEYKGETKLLIEWAKELSIPYSYLRPGFKSGRTVEDIVNRSKSIKIKPKRFRKIVQMDAETGRMIRIYKSGWDARKDGFSPEYIYDCAKGERKIYLGFKWAYVASLISFK